MSTIQEKKIDGKGIAQDIAKEIAVECASVTEKLGRKPGLAVVLVGRT